MRKSFYDEQGHVFKLDNAASFNMDTSKVEAVLKYGKKEPPAYVMQLIINGLDFIEYENYGRTLRDLNKYYGRLAVESGFDLIRRFSEIDLSKIEAACDTLEKIYPDTITEYYPAFIERRVNACKRFLEELSISQFTDYGRAGMTWSCLPI